MLSEHDVGLNLDNIATVIWVVILQMLEDFELNARLMLELFLVPDDFDSDDFAVHVVDAFQCLAEAALSEEVKNFKSEPDMVVYHY